METAALTIDEIKLKLEEVPQEKLTEVHDFIEFILLRSKSRPKKKKKKRVFGSAKGLIKIAPDFDEPLEDFKDYM
jgi:hypothetical protein